MTSSRWMKRNQATVIIGAAAIASYLLYKKYASSRFAVRGVWTDLATKQGISVGPDLSVQETQMYLNGINNQAPPARGGKGLAEDGMMGPKTVAAVTKFQIGNGLPATGVVDEETGNALSYFAAATSKSGALQKYASVSPDTISSLSPKRRSRPVSKRAAPSLFQAVDIGGGWVMYGNSACHWNDADCAARSGGILPTLPPPSISAPSSSAPSSSQIATSGQERHLTGIQSSSMFDAARSTYTDPYGNAVDGNVRGYGWDV